MKRLLLCLLLVACQGEPTSKTASIGPAGGVETERDKHGEVGSPTTINLDPNRYLPNANALVFHGDSGEILRIEKGGDIVISPWAAKHMSKAAIQFISIVKFNWPDYCKGEKNDIKLSRNRK